VREIAAELGLVTAAKPDSQDICFVTSDYTEVVKRLRPTRENRARSLTRRGGHRPSRRHREFHHRQRKGLGLSGTRRRCCRQADTATRRVVVGPRQALLTRRMS